MSRRLLSGKGFTHGGGGGGGPPPSSATFDQARSYNGSLDSSTSLTFTASSALGTKSGAVALGHISGTDKRYFEVAVTIDGATFPMMIGLANLSYVITNSLEGDAHSISYTDLGRVYYNNTNVVPGMPVYGAGARVQIAVDAGNAKAWFRLNGGIWNNNGSANPVSNVGGVDISAITGSLYPIVVCQNVNDAVVGKFDSSSWTGTAPSGFTQVPLDTYSAATFDPSNSDSHITLSNGNLTATSSGGGAGTNVAITRSRNGLKFYCEATITTMAGTAEVGVITASGGGGAVTLGGNSTVVSGVNLPFANGITYVQDGTVYRAGSTVMTILPFTSGNTIAMAMDTVNQAVWFNRYSGGSWGNWNNNSSANPGANVGGISAGTLFNLTNMSILAVANLYTSGDSWTANFGGSAYLGTPPTGFGNW